MSSGSNITEESLNPWKTTVMSKVDERIKLLKTKIKPTQTNPVLKQTDVISYLDQLKKEFVFVPIDKAASNVAIICKRYYLQVILKEIRILGDGNKTYCKANREKDEIINENIEYTKRLNFKTTEKEETLPIMYWIPKLHKNPIGTRFIIASKCC